MLLWTPQVTCHTQFPLFYLLSQHQHCLSLPGVSLGPGTSAGPLRMMNHGSHTQKCHPLDPGVAAALPSVDRFTEAQGIKQPMREYGWHPADGDLGCWCQSLNFAQDHVHVHGGKPWKHSPEESQWCPV